MKRIANIMEIIILLITIFCMNFFYPQYYESEFPLFIDLFTTPIFLMFVILNILVTIMTLKYSKNNIIRLSLSFLYVIGMLLLFMRVIDGNKNIFHIKIAFIVIQSYVLSVALISKKIKSLNIF